LLLVLAVDVSPSVDEDDAHLQRRGYREALTDSAVLAAARSGPNGAIGVAYIEWSAPESQHLVVPWMRIASEEDGLAWAMALDQRTRRSDNGTAIGNAIEFARRAFAGAPWKSLRRVIDVSGDGADNGGFSVQAARDHAVAEGITINGLAIEGDVALVLEGHARPGGGGHPLADYYRRTVIGGPGAFVVEANGFGAFRDAVRRKLVREIAEPAPIAQLA
jgi:hypothetical protein